MGFPFLLSLFVFPVTTTYYNTKQTPSTLLFEICGGGPDRWGGFLSGESLRCFKNDGPNKFRSQWQSREHLTGVSCEEWRRRILSWDLRQYYAGVRLECDQNGSVRYRQGGRHRTNRLGPEGFKNHLLQCHGLRPGDDVYRQSLWSDPDGLNESRGSKIIYRLCRLRSKIIGPGWSRLLLAVSIIAASVLSNNAVVVASVITTCWCLNRSSLL